MAHCVEDFFIKRGPRRGCAYDIHEVDVVLAQGWKHPWFKKSDLEVDRVEKGAKVGKPIVSGSGDGSSCFKNRSGKAGQKLVVVNQGMKVCACWCASSYVTDQLNDLSNALFAVKLTKPNSPKSFGGIDNFAWEVTVEAHLG